MAAVKTYCRSDKKMTANAASTIVNHFMRNLHRCCYRDCARPAEQVVGCLVVELLSVVVVANRSRRGCPLAFMAATSVWSVKQRGWRSRAITDSEMSKRKHVNMRRAL
jgi:hypothetical protein